MAVDVGSAVGYLDLDISGFLAGLKSAQEEADKKSKGIGDKISGIGDKLSSTGKTLTKKVTLPLVGVGAAGLKVATDFEKGMSEVSAITGEVAGEVGSRFDALREKAIELGADTAFSAGEVAEAMTEMAKAGWDADLIISDMGGVLNAAAASGEGLATVATIVADAMTGFGDETLTSARVADLLTQAANSGTIGITDLGESFKYIAPVAGSMGLGIEDVTTAISAMSMAGIKGSQAGTSLRTMLTNLVKPSDNMAIAMEELGISATEADGSMKSLDDIVANLRDSFSGLTEAEKAKYAATIAGKEGMSGMLALLNLTEEEYNAIALSMDNAGGVAEETAAIMQDNLQSKVEQLGGALESMAIKLADALLPHLETFVIWLTQLVDKFTALDPETQKTILTIAGLVLVMGPAISIIGKLTSGVGGIVTAFGKLGSKGSTASTAISTVGNAGSGATKGVSSAATSFGNLAGQALKLVAVGASFYMIGAGIKMIADSAIAVANAGPGAMVAFGLLIAGAVGLTAAIVAIGGASTATAPGLLALGAAVALVSGGIALLVKAIGTTVSKIIDSIGNSAVKAGDGFETLSNAILNLVNNTKLGDLVTTFGSVTKGIKDINKAASDSDKAANNINSFANAVGNAARSAASATSTSFTNMNTSVSSFGTNISNVSLKTTTSINGVKTATRNGAIDVKTNMNNLALAITSAMTKGTQSMANFVTSFKSQVASIKQEIRDLQTTFANTKFSFNKRIELPHFYMYGSFNAKTGAVPSVGVSWYKKAMDAGMILNSPTIFGFDPATGKFLGGGEAGSETVVGTNSLMNMIRQSVDEALSPIISVMYDLAKASVELGYVTYNGFTKIKDKFEKESGRSDNDKDGRGDTFIFNSPKAIDEIEAAKQMKRTKREMAEGF